MVKNCLTSKNRASEKAKGVCDLKREYELDEHLRDANEVAESLGLKETSKGLSESQVEMKINEFGYNELTPPKKTPEWIKFLLKFVDPFSILLWIGAGMCLVLIFVELGSRRGASAENIVLVSVLVSVNLISGTYGYFQERKSSKILDKFKKMTSNLTIVIRDGGESNIESRLLVPGDVVVLKSGDKVPADLRILNSNALRIDNSALTGESEPQFRHAAKDEEGVKGNQATCVIFAGTNVVEGTCTGLVIKTGDSSMVGRIAQLTSNLNEKKTLIAKEISEFLQIIMIIAILLGVMVGIYQLVLGHYIEAISFTVSIIVANVPEGLILTVTVSLSMAAKAMNARSCRVKDLKCVETLGSTSCICSDKTGTLTQNAMSVSHMYLDHNIHSISQVDQLSARTSSELLNKSIISKQLSWKRVMRVATLCNRSQFLKGETNMPVTGRKASGDGSEVALLKYSHTYFSNVLNYRSSHQKVAEIPFNSVNKYQVSIHKLENEKRNLIVMKGAPERIIERCSSIIVDNKIVEMDEQQKAKIQAGILDLSKMGERVLGFCEKELDPESYPIDFEFDPQTNFPELSGLLFCGFISLIDPPRVNVPDSVIKCRNAGIKVAMVTGDFQVTAKAIARKVNIISNLNQPSADEIAHQRLTEARESGEFTLEELEEKFKKIIVNDLKNGIDTDSIVLNGDQIESLSEEQLTKVCGKYSEMVFARTSPQQKLRIVEAMQSAGFVTAVTGDGVNDAPALKKADIGIAMGLTGTDVSKESCDMELMDDNFSSIVNGVEEGRRLFENLKKSVVYTLTSNIPEIFPVIVSLIFGTSMILGAIPVLFIDVGTDLLPAISFSYEKSESDILNQRPRNPKHEKLVTPKLITMAYIQIGLIQFLAAFTSYLVWLKCEGIDFNSLRGTFKLWDEENLLIEHITKDGKRLLFTERERRDIQYTGYSIFLVAIVIVQYADLVISKTRRLSIFQHGMRQNKFMLFSLLAETAFCIIFVYGLGNMHESIPMRPVPWYGWVVPIPFALAIFIYDEVRKFFVRKRGKIGDFVREVTYY